MSTTELTEATFDKFVAEKSRILVDFFDPTDAEGKEHQKALEQALVSVRGYGKNTEFAKVDASKEKQLAGRYVPNARYPQLIWFANGHPTEYHRTLRSSKNIADFVLALDRPSIIEITDASEASEYNPAVLAEIPKGGDLYKTVDAVALKHMDMVAFMVLESNKNTISWTVDGVVKHKFEGTPSVDALHKWVKAELPHKSEEVPQGDLAFEGGVHVVVNKNFEEEVFQKEKDVMLLAHAPWCGFCKKLMPQWRQFARRVSNIPHLTVAQIDGSRNDSPLPGNFEWTSYPTIFYVRAGQHVPVIYKGNRTVESLLSFAKEHSSKPLEDSNISDVQMEDVDL